MQIHNLQNTDLEILSETFNKAFEGYFVPLKLTSQQLQDKIKSENIVLEQSVGVTINSQLAGFILIGVNPESNIAYNAGTGIIPEFRGQKLTEKMYSYFLPKLGEIGIKNHLLEVICQNERALKVYQNLGYTISRKVICYKGRISEPKKTESEIELIEWSDEAHLKQCWNHNPTYQNSLFCIKNDWKKHNTFGKFSNGKLVGYVIFVKDTLRIKQFGVDKDFRNKGIGHDLLFGVQNQIMEKDISIINVDQNDLETNGFLQKIGLIPFVEQFEMKLAVK